MEYNGVYVVVWLRVHLPAPASSVRGTTAAGLAGLAGCVGARPSAEQPGLPEMLAYSLKLDLGHKLDLLLASWIVSLHEFRLSRVTVALVLFEVGICIVTSLRLERESFSRLEFPPLVLLRLADLHR